MRLELLAVLLKDFDCVCLYFGAKAYLNIDRKFRRE